MGVTETSSLESYKLIGIVMGYCGYNVRAIVENSFLFLRLELIMDTLYIKNVQNIDLSLQQNI